jgi:hypothetical protein
MLFVPREPWLGAAPGRTLALAIAACLCACRPVRISRLRIELVPFHPFILMALCLCGTRAAALVGLSGLLAAALARKPKPASFRLLFNLGCTAIAAVGAGLVLHALGGKTGDGIGPLVGPLAGAATAFFLVGTGLVAAAISLETAEPYVATWKRSLLWTAWSSLAGAAIALAGCALFAISPVMALAVTTAPCWGLVLFYRMVARESRAAAAA